MMGEALPAIQALGGGGTLFISVAAGTSIATFENVLGQDTPIVRAMPNTPAAIRQGITAVIGNGCTSDNDLSLAENMLSAIGETVRLEDRNRRWTRSPASAGLDRPMSST